MPNYSPTPSSIRCCSHTGTNKTTLIRILPSSLSLLYWSTNANAPFFAPDTQELAVFVSAVWTLLGFGGASSEGVRSASLRFGTFWSSRVKMMRLWSGYMRAHGFESLWSCRCDSFLPLRTFSHRPLLYLFPFSLNISHKWERAMSTLRFLQLVCLMRAFHLLGHLIRILNLARKRPSRG